MNKWVKAKWCEDSVDQYDWNIYLKPRPRTEEEEADEIVKRLKAAPKKNPSMEELISQKLTREMALEIDKEILECLNYNLSTQTYSAKK